MRVNNAELSHSITVEAQGNVHIYIVAVLLQGSMDEQQCVASVQENINFTLN